MTELRATASSSAAMASALCELALLRVRRPRVLLDGTEVSDLYEGRELAVLEPSAGLGVLAEEIRRRGYRVDCIEIDELLAGELLRKDFFVYRGDFLELHPLETETGTGTFQYDRIVMNPPFANDQDLAHVQHAYTFLAPGGILVSGIQDLYLSHQQPAHVDFRRWVAEHRAELVRVKDRELSPRFWHSALRVSRPCRVEDSPRRSY